MTRPPLELVCPLDSNLFCHLDCWSVEFLMFVFVAAPRDIVVLPDEEEEEVPLRERRRRGKGSSGKAPEVQVP